MQKKGRLPGSVNLNLRAGSKVLCSTWKAPEELARMCRHGICPTGLWGCLVGSKQSCMNVEPFQWAKVLGGEDGDAQGAS